VQGLHAADNLDEVVPDLLLGQLHPGPLLLVDDAEDVASVGELHHDAEVASLVLEEGILVADDVGMLDGSQDPDLVEGILLLLLGKLAHLDLLHGVEGSVRDPLDRVDLAEGAFAQLFQNKEVCDFAHVSAI